MSREDMDIDEVIVMLKVLLAGKDVKAKTKSEKSHKKALLRDIAYAKKKGYQIEIPYI